MRFSEIDSRLKEQVFEFLFLYSRWEYVLKENEFLKKPEAGKNANACWYSFVSQFADQYEPTEDANELIKMNPQRQIIGGDGKKLVWRAVGYDDCTNDLCRVVRTLQTVRNNLFHGGKHGVEGWDDPERVSALVRLGSSVMCSLARQIEWDHQVERYY